ncbi:MAG: LarC family nickel insertion protein, partial [Lachnospiraceae bacterium]|nr:LarC family nickel insertion protein [Lachnospiraceae bacterium]
MRTLYIDCSMGAAGDMLTAALYELIEDKEAYINKINSIGIKDVTVSAREMTKCGIVGTHMDVLVNGVSEGDEMEHHHE